MITTNDKFSKQLLTAILLVAAALILLGLWVMKPSKPKPEGQSQPTPQATVSQPWQLCWEKIPGAKGTTNIRSQCFPVKVSKNRNSIVLVYQHNDRQGTMEASSSDGAVYDGLWKDPGGWGNFHIRFTSPTSAVGWVDEKGKKPINLWLSPK